jgi:hypothetical protein
MMKRSTLIGRLALAAGAVVAVQVALCRDARDARACGFAMEIEIERHNPTVEGVSQAEKYLEDGKLLLAAIYAHHEYPDIHDGARDNTNLEERAQKVMALAVARTNGALTLGTDFRGWSASLRESSLEWAVGTLKAMSAKHPNDPSIETPLAEAMSKLPKYEGDAYAILKDLGDKDVIVSPQGWATLAQLRVKHGDQGSDAATQRCEQIAESTLTCQLPNG